VTAVVAAYFYLRVAVLMYAAGGLGEPEGATAGGSAELDYDESMAGGGIITATAPPEIPDEGVAVPVAERPATGGLAWATPASAAGAVTTLNEQILLSEEGKDEGEEAVPEQVPVPPLSALAIGVCTGVTVLFGVWPQPLIDFANHATLLFLPH
jgi:hypothetical protein